MEAVGAGASILTFITFAHSIHSALSAIKDGPEVIRRLTAEIAQLESVLRRLNELSFVSVDDIDKSQLDGLAKKCKNDLAELDSRLKSLNVSTSDGRRGRLWRKLKLYFSEKDLEQIRNIVRDHVLHLGLQLDLILAQQVSFTANESINRLMRLLEKKPCVIESDDSEELLKDIEHLLECVRKDTEPVESEGAGQNCQPDVSKELKLMINIMLSSPSMMINQTPPGRLGRPTDKKFLISPERKRKAFETDDGVITVTTAKRRRKASSGGENENAKNEARRDFLAKLTYMSKRTKKMLSLSANQRQLLFNNFSSTLPCITVCNILPIDSLVFGTTRNGSVQDLVRLLEGGEANIHDHDTNGWSLLHHSVGNVPVLKFSIGQGLDIDEVADRPEGDSQTSPSHISLAYFDSIGNYESLLDAGADMTLEVKGTSFTVIEYIASHDTELGYIKLDQTLHKSPFVYEDTSATHSQNLIARAAADCYVTVQSKPGQALQQIQLLIKRGYNVNSTFAEKGCLHHLMHKIPVWLRFLPEYLQLLMLLLEHGADVYCVDEDGYQASHYAYDIMCETCYLFGPSAKGDLWDAAQSLRA
ncbi:hypothetical protein FAGAP_6840 [Fusarium agapanthi]|uniref:Azaphilone pigments biosynthesis cluster protein L N-terminal domain-containing protein n=1 Tax=Fusarium agapanthi TaxID=1803897 RepID=A0A9P5B6T8_9HYPO|nr:hypothetical protein FAGAP_6840 [Fusarium agapanthi]